MSLALVALGANLGDPAAALRWALRRLEGLGRVRAVSKLYRTRPVGGPDGQPDYLNAAVSLSTELGPRALLRGLLALETEYGRVRLERWGARVLDLDLIAYDDLILSGPDLSLPHPRAWERAFVLLPLNDVAPDYPHPQSGETVRAAALRVGEAGVARLGAL